MNAQIHGTPPLDRAAKTKNETPHFFHTLFIKCLKCKPIARKNTP